jgi:hypothetical protein
MPSNKRFLAYLTGISLLSVYYNLRLVSKVNVFDNGERFGDTFWENLKVLPANCLIHVSRFGLGHRLIRDTSAYHLAKSLELTRMKFQWGSCSKDTNWKGQKLSIFPYLFGDDTWIIPSTSVPKPQGKRVIVRNDIYGYVPGQSFKNYALPIPKDRYKSYNGPFWNKLASDSEFYNRLVESYVFKDQVDAFMEEHNIANHEVIGIHLRVGNGETAHFQWGGRQIKNESEFMSNLMQLIQTFLERIQSQHADRFETRKPLIFLATDTPRLIPDVINATAKFGVKTIHLEQIRVKTDEGVTFKAFAGKEEKCLEGWQAMVSDMMLLAQSDVLIAVRHSSFTQSLPLARVFDQHKREKGPHFCEVCGDGDAMTCLEDKRTWMFRDDPKKIFRYTIEDKNTTHTSEELHRLLVHLPDIEKPKDFQEAIRFLKAPRNVNQTEGVLMHTYGKKGFNPKYRKEKEQKSAWNFIAR